MPSDLAATTMGSWVTLSVVTVDVFAAAETSLAAFSNSRFAWSIDLAISGSFDSPPEEENYEYDCYD